MARIVVTPGMGIGPEVAARALAADRTWVDQALVVGRASAFLPQAEAVGLTVERVDDLGEGVAAGVLPFFDPGDADEPTEVAAIRFAAHACLAEVAPAMVTGPIHKKRLQDRGFAFNGHTDFLEHLTGAKRAVMAFAGGELRVALVTTHVPLMQVGELLDSTDIVRVVGIVGQALRRDLGIERPRIAVCGLNPHAGEGGAGGGLRLLEPRILVVGPSGGDPGRGDRGLKLAHGGGQRPPRRRDSRAARLQSPVLLVPAPLQGLWSIRPPPRAPVKRARCCAEGGTGRREAVRAPHSQPRNRATPACPPRARVA